MAFQPSVAGVTDDAAIQFLSGPFRKASVSIAIGATSARLAANPAWHSRPEPQPEPSRSHSRWKTTNPQQTSLTIPRFADHSRYRYRCRAAGLASMSPSRDSTTPIRHRNWFLRFTTSRATSSRRARSTSTPARLPAVFQHHASGRSVRAARHVSGNRKHEPRSDLSRSKIRQFHRSHHHPTDPHRAATCPTRSFDITGRMLLASVVETSRRVADTTKRLEKIDLLARLIRQLSPEEIEIVVLFLSGQTRQGRIGIGYAALRDARHSPAADPVTRNPRRRPHPPGDHRDQWKRLPATPLGASANDVFPRHRSRAAIPHRPADG